MKIVIISFLLLIVSFSYGQEKFGNITVKEDTTKHFTVKVYTDSLNNTYVKMLLRFNKDNTFSTEAEETFIALPKNISEDQKMALLKQVDAWIAWSKIQK